MNQQVEVQSNYMQGTQNNKVTSMTVNQQTTSVRQPTKCKAPNNNGEAKQKQQGKRKRRKEGIKRKMTLNKKKSEGRGGEKK